MKKLVLAVLAAMTLVMAGCATSRGDLVGTRADTAFPEGSYSATPE